MQAVGELLASSIQQAKAAQLNPAATLLPEKTILSRSHSSTENASTKATTIQTRISSIQKTFRSIEENIVLLRDRLGIEASLNNREVLSKIADFLSLKYPSLVDDFRTIPILYGYLNGYQNDILDSNFDLTHSDNQISILNSAINLNEYISQFLQKIEPIIICANNFTEHQVFSGRANSGIIGSNRGLKRDPSQEIKIATVYADAKPQSKLILGAYLPLDKSEAWHKATDHIEEVKMQELNTERLPGEIDIHIDLANPELKEKLLIDKTLNLPCFTGYKVCQIQIDNADGSKKNLSDLNLYKDLTGLVYVKGLIGGEKIKYRLEAIATQEKPSFSELSQQVQNLSPFPSYRSALKILKDQIEKLDSVATKIKKIKEYLKAQMPIDFSHPVIDSVLEQCPDSYVATDAMLVDRFHLVPYITKLLREFKIPAFSLDHATLKNSSNNAYDVTSNNVYPNEIGYYDEEGNLNALDLEEIFNSTELIDQKKLISSLEEFLIKIPRLNNEQIHSELYAIASRHKKRKGNVENLNQVASYIDERQKTFDTVLQALKSNEIKAFIDFYSQYRSLCQDEVDYKNFLYNFQGIDENAKLQYYKGLGANSMAELDFLITQVRLDPSLDDLSYLAKNLNELFAKEEEKKQKYIANELVDKEIKDEGDREFYEGFAIRMWYLHQIALDVSESDHARTKVYIKLIGDLLKNISKDQLDLIWHEEEMQKTLKFLEARIMDADYNDARNENSGLELQKIISFLPKVVRHDLLDQAYFIKALNCNETIVQYSLDSNVHDRFADAFYITEDGEIALNPKSQNLNEVKKVYEQIIEDLLTKANPKKLTNYLIDLSRIKDIGLVFSSELKDKIVEQIAQVSILNTEFLADNPDQKIIYDSFLKLFTSTHQSSGNPDPLSRCLSFNNLHLPKTKIQNLEELYPVLIRNLAKYKDLCAQTLALRSMHLGVLPDRKDLPSLNLWKQLVPGTEKERQRKLFHDFLAKLEDNCPEDYEYELSEKLEEIRELYNNDLFEKYIMPRMLDSELGKLGWGFMSFLQSNSKDKDYIDELLNMNSKEAIVSKLREKFANLPQWQDQEKDLETIELSTLKLAFVSFKYYRDLHKESPKSVTAKKEIPNYIFASSILESIKSLESKEDLKAHRQRTEVFYHDGENYLAMLKARTKTDQVLEEVFKLPMTSTGAGSASLKSSLQRGTLEFNGTRPYAKGDRARDIHWRAFARTGLLQSINRVTSTEHEDLHFVFNFNSQYKGFYKDLNSLFNTMKNAFYRGQNCFLHLANNGKRLISINPEHLKEILCSNGVIDDDFSKRTFAEDLFLSTCELKNISPHRYKNFLADDWETKFDSLCKKGDRVYFLGEMESLQKPVGASRTIFDYLDEKRIKHYHLCS